MTDEPNTNFIDMACSYLIFDTETTGLPLRHLPPEHDDQPRIVQLACELHDGEKTLGSCSFIVEPNRDIPKEASDIHGITNEVAKRHGVNPIVALAAFNALAVKADILVAHNAEFDVRIIRGEYIRNNRTEHASAIFDSKQIICTMLSSAPILKIPKPAKYQRPGDMYKWPNLQQAYCHLVDSSGFSGAHDAMADVRACRDVLFGLIRAGSIAMKPPDL